jgi:hypothetical protein
MLAKIWKLEKMKWLYELRNEFGIDEARTNSLEAPIFRQAL